MTQMVMGMLKMQNPDEITFQSINFNFYTTSAVLQVRDRRLHGCLLTAHGTTWTKAGQSMSLLKSCAILVMMYGSRPSSKDGWLHLYNFSCRQPGQLSLGLLCDRLHFLRAEHDGPAVGEEDWHQFRPTGKQQACVLLG